MVNPTDEADRTAAANGAQAGGTSSELFAGPGEMRARCRALDWNATPLGPVDAWPPHLRTAADLVLASGFAMVLHYGPEAIQLYNDACAPSLGPRHPEALGRSVYETFPETRAAVEALHARVRDGETVTVADQAFPMLRDGVLRDVVWTFSYAPLRDQAGAVAGVLVTAVDMTARVADEARLRAAEARQRFLLALNDRLRPITDPHGILHVAAHALGEHLGASRVGYAEIEADDAHLVVTRHYADGVPAIEGRYRVADYGPTLLPLLDAGRTVVYPDTANDPTLGDAEKAAHAALQVGAAVTVPLTTAGRLAGVMFMHHREARAWSPDDLALLEAVAERTRDAVERARAEAALRASEARFRTVQDASPLGFAIHRPVREGGRPDGRVVDFTLPYVNAAGARIVGRSRDELTAGTVLGLWPGTGPEGVFADYVRVLETGQPFEREILYEHEELVAGLTLTVVRIGGGAGAELGVTFTDVTARLRAERERDALLRALREERERLRAVILQMPASVALLEGREHRYALVNEPGRRLSGGRDLTGLTLREAFPELAEQGLIEHYDEVYATGRPWVGPETLLRYDRQGQGVIEDVWLNLHLEPLRATADAAADGGDGAGPGPGPVTGILAFGVDVTEQVRARREVERLLAESQVTRADAEAARAAAEAASRAKGEFLAVMSHELRTPLNAIGGYAELLGMGLHGPVTEAQRGALARVQGAQRRLLALINDVLNYARLESGRVEYALAVVDLREVVADVVPLLEPQLAAKGLALDVRLPDGPCAVWTDREKLGQVLVNLLSNATKFTDARHPATGAPGRVTVAVATRRGAAADAVFLRVSDTGRGIPRAKQAAIFEPFVQVRVGAGTAYAQATEGTGLGLAISRDLARGMGGDLRVRSREGEGAAFTVVLRRAAAPDGPARDRRTHEERRAERERRSGEDRRAAPRDDGEDGA